ncbi:DUF6895 family protein [Embleya sp. AB8]|uniref:DUF6895 family protein n=1 Tax=Embleya sp. AB8 TaxID=3156304 RepID=UPI003C749511
MSSHPDLLRRVALRSLTWLDEHRDGFRLPDDVIDAGNHNTTLKPVGELARLGVSIRRANRPGSRAYDLADGLLDFAWRQTRAGDVLFTLSRAQPQATYPLEIYASFAAAGLRHPEFEDLTRFLSATRAWQALELEPTRELAVLGAQRLLGLAPRPNDVERTMRRTWLGTRPEPWMFEVRSGYALTHYVFHVTDWGEVPERLPDDIRAYLDLWLPAWLDCCLDEEQWDLSGELLAVAASLPEPASLPDAWQRLAPAQEPSGALPEVGHPPGTDQDPFLYRYHSTLVLAFAASLAAARLGTEDAAESEDIA